MTERQDPDAAAIRCALATENARHAEAEGRDPAYWRESLRQAERRVRETFVARARAESSASPTPAAVTASSSGRERRPGARPASRGSSSRGDPDQPPPPAGRLFEDDPWSVDARLRAVWALAHQGGRVER